MNRTFNTHPLHGARGERLVLFQVPRFEHVAQALEWDKVEQPALPRSNAETWFQHSKYPLVKR